MESLEIYQMNGSGTCLMRLGCDSQGRSCMRGFVILTRNTKVDQRNFSACTAPWVLGQLRRLLSQTYLETDATRVRPRRALGRFAGERFLVCVA